MAKSEFYNQIADLTRDARKQRDAERGVRLASICVDVAAGISDDAKKGLTSHYYFFDEEDMNLTASVAKEFLENGFVITLQGDKLIIEWEPSEWVEAGPG